VPLAIIGFILEVRGESNSPSYGLPPLFFFPMARTTKNAMIEKQFPWGLSDTITWRPLFAFVGLQEYCRFYVLWLDEHREEQHKKIPWLMLSQKLSPCGGGMLEYA
jgi:hypothetical protein